MATFLPPLFDGTDLAMYRGGAGRGQAMTAFLPPPFVPQYVSLSIRACLEGPYDPWTGMMNDALRTLPLFPLSEPYTALGYSHVGSGSESFSPAVLTTSGNNAIVDWVVVELRDVALPSVVLATRSALLQRDGDIVDLDGASPVTMGIEPGSYLIAIRHRNHLGVMTANPVQLNLAPTTLDFSSPALSTYGTNARKSVTGAFPAQVLWAGDANFNGQVKYTGSGNDRDPILTTVGSTTPNNTVTNTYSTRDVNMNGQVKYTGSGNDRDPILLNVGSTAPNATRVQQLP